MDTLERNNFIKKLPRPIVYGVIGVGALLALLFVATALSNSFGGQMHTLGIDSDYAMDEYNRVETAMPAVAPMGSGVAYEQSYAGEAAMSLRADGDMGGRIISPVPPMYPGPDFVAGLEDYETTDYYAHARTTDFDDACGLLTTFKQDTDIHFSSLSAGLNDCSGRFYTPKERVDEVVQKLRDIQGIDIQSDTSSVTRVKEDLTSRTDVIRQQLADTEATLAKVTVQYEDIVSLAFAKGDPAALNRVVSSKFELLDQLNQRRLQLSLELEQLLQAATDLDGRIDKVAFNVSFTRAYPIRIDEQSQQWEAAWQYLKRQGTETLIGLTLYLGVFALRAIQFIFYGFIVLILARFLWKFVRVIWRS